MVFLPLFVGLGVWQLNRATEKEQFLAVDAEPVDLADLDPDLVPVYRQSVISGRIPNRPVFLVDNKTFAGQFGYEVFVPTETRHGMVMLSLGWLKGSTDRDQLPVMVLPPAIAQQRITWRQPPTNPVLGSDANSRHPKADEVWIVQNLTADWVEQQIGQRPLGFAQLNDAQAVGVGPVIWTPSVMTPTKHRAYAVQWFAMAAALFGMFLYAGLRAKASEATTENNNKRGSKE